MIRYCLGIVLSVAFLFGHFPDLRAADDKAKRERKAAAALALAASAKTTAAKAPAPHKAGPCEYADGHARSLLDQKPLVVFVGCEVQACEGAICSTVKGHNFGAVQAPAIVIGFPRGQTLYIDSTLACPASAADLNKAIRNASKKIDVPLAKPMPQAPAPATWHVNADGSGCVCGDGCKCKSGECPSRCPVQTITKTASEGDGLDEVNAQRAARGLRPFLRDDGLAAAARACAAHRATYLLFGHTNNDFGFCPSGVHCDATGCAAYPASYGWLSCCTFENYTRAGAAWALGRDGKRYMHLFVGYGAPSGFATPTQNVAPQPMPDPRSCPSCDSGVVVKQPAQPQRQLFRFQGRDQHGRLVEWYEWRDVAPSIQEPPPMEFIYPNQLRADLGQDCSGST